MTKSDPALRSLAGAVALGLLSTACIITSSGDDDNGDASDGNPAETGLPETTGGPADTGETDGPPGNCSSNLVLDPGFEGGTPNPSWTESSALFGTPICDAACTDEPGAAPYAGSWWVWMGGASEEDIMNGGSESASVSQTVTIDPDAAYLSFRFQIRSGAGTGDDAFTVTLDGDTVFMATDLEMSDYSDYTYVEVDVSPWADGGTYDLVFNGTQVGPGLTSFYLDEVSLVSCSDDTGTSSGSSDGQDGTAGTFGDSSSGTGDAGSTGDTGTTGGGSGSSSG